MNGIKVLLFVACFCLTSCHKQPVTIIYILPDGFRGAFSLAQDEHGPEDVQWLGNVATITISSNGIAHTRSPLPSRNLHDIQAHYANGQKLPVDLVGTSGSEIALRRIPPRANEFNKEWLVVGDAEDVRRAIEKQDGFSFPLQ